MTDIWLRRAAWAIAFSALILLAISAVMLFLAPDHSNLNWLENQVKAIVTLGAPMLGVIIVMKQPRHRVGWLWLAYGLVVGLRTLGHAIYYFGGSRPIGYSPLEYFLLWFTEPASLAGLLCLVLLMLWFPDGQLVSRRWRILYVWLFFALGTLFLGLFTAGPNWNGGAGAGGIVIDNPFGWLPDTKLDFLVFPALISIVLITILAAVSLIVRYHRAGQLTRLQLRWFVLGGVLYVCLVFLPVLFIGATRVGAGSNFLLLLSFSSIVPLYAAVGVAILRYRLYSIDVIIRKTLVYTTLTVLLALVYFGSVIVLQQILSRAGLAVLGRTASPNGQSPLAVVVSTLVIAALFTPLRRRVQDAIDRRFYRKKYDAQQVLAQFALTARDETNLDALVAELVRVVDETLQPEHVSVWLRKPHNAEASDTHS